jgi:hypothetical protein
MRINGFVRAVCVGTFLLGLSPWTVPIAQAQECAQIQVVRPGGPGEAKWVGMGSRCEHTNLVCKTGDKGSWGTCQQVPAGSNPATDPGSSCGCVPDEGTAQPTPTPAPKPVPPAPQPQPPKPTPDGASEWAVSIFLILVAGWLVQRQRHKRRASKA